MKIAPGPEVGGPGARKVVAKYQPGKQVMVFYDPQNPSDAVLERKAPAQWVMWLLLVIFDCVLCGGSCRSCGLRLGSDWIQNSGISKIPEFLFPPHS